MLFAVSFSAFCLMSYCGETPDFMQITSSVAVQLVEHQSWQEGFDARPGHTEDLKNGTSGLSRDVTRLDGARGKEQVWRHPPIFETEVFRKQMYCIEESVCDIVGTFPSPAVIWCHHTDSAPGELRPLWLPSLPSRSVQPRAQLQMGGCKEWVYARCCHWLATSAALTVKAVGWSTAQT